jgi:hypothetical protein
MTSSINFSIVKPLHIIKSKEEILGMVGWLFKFNSRINASTVKIVTEDEVIQFSSGNRKKSSNNYS